MKSVLKLNLALLFGLIISAAIPGSVSASEYYRCNGMASCSCVPGRPGLVCDYFGTGQGEDQASAAANAKADANAKCDDDCSRKTGFRCHSQTAYNCLLIRTFKRHPDRNY